MFLLNKVRKDNDGNFNMCFICLYNITLKYTEIRAVNVPKVNLRFKSDLPNLALVKCIIKSHLLKDNSEVINMSD